jgi:hypothetical protein
MHVATSSGTLAVLARSCSQTTAAWKHGQPPQFNTLDSQAVEIDCA